MNMPAPNTARSHSARRRLLLRERSEDGQFLAMTVVFMTMFLAPRRPGG